MTREPYDQGTRATSTRPTATSSRRPSLRSSLGMWKSPTIVLVLIFCCAQKKLRKRCIIISSLYAPPALMCIVRGMQSCKGDAELHENCRTVKTDLQQNHITYKILKIKD